MRYAVVESSTHTVANVIEWDSVAVIDSITEQYALVLLAEGERCAIGSTYGPGTPRFTEPPEPSE